MNNKALLKARNRTLILKALQRTPGLTRGELAQITKLSFPAISKLAQRFIEEDIIRENGKQNSSGGRCSDLLEINPEAGDIIGIDIALNYINIVTTDFCFNPKTEYYASGNLTKMNNDQINSFITQSLIDYQKKYGFNFNSVKCAGIGLNGYINNNGDIFSSVLPQFTKLNTKELFPVEFPVFIENGGNLEAIRELILGDGQGKCHIACLVVKDGVGSGLILNGQLYTGTDGIAGEFGAARKLWPELDTTYPTQDQLIDLVVKYAYIAYNFLNLQNIYICGDIEDYRTEITEKINHIFEGKLSQDPIKFSNSGIQGACIGAAIYARKNLLGEMEFSDDYNRITDKVSLKNNPWT